MKYAMLKRIQEIYASNENIIAFLKKQNEGEMTSVEDILISYDFQAGTYKDSYIKNPDFKLKATKELFGYIENFNDVKTIVEIGVGEATTLVPLLKNFQDLNIKAKGIDLSWSRIKYGMELVEEEKLKDSVELATGDLFQLPFQNNSVDLIYTFHSLEPNGGREKEALQELYRVAKKYIVLVEPSYEMGTEEQKERMNRNGYVKNLKSVCLELGYKIICYEKFSYNINPLNSAAILIIEKNLNEDGNEFEWSCPYTQTKLKKINGSYFSDKSLLVYPTVADIPCLLPENAIVATKFLE